MRNTISVVKATAFVHKLLLMQLELCTDFQTVHSVITDRETDFDPQRLTYILINMFKGS